jgi:hypothetical protein
MSNQTLFIPKKLNVGFQLREGTYTGKLAYVIYWDNKGILRKADSWNIWRHKPGNKTRVQVKTGEGRWDYRWEDRILGDEVEPIILDNVPTEGFVLNKGVGGQRESWGWNARNEYIRVYDPRGFEFEISVENLLYILQECTSTKGKGLEGQFVYSWDGTELVLLPVGTYEYNQSSNYTKLQSKKVTKDDIIEGGTYLSKKQETLVYVGRFPWYSHSNDRDDDGILKVTSKLSHVFYDTEKQTFQKHDGYVKLGSVISTECIDGYAELVDKFKATANASKAVQLILIPKQLELIRREGWNRDDVVGNYYIYQDNNPVRVDITHDTTYVSTTDEYVSVGYTVRRICRYNLTEDGCIHASYFRSGYSYFDRNRNLDDVLTKVEKDELLKFQLFEMMVVTENGSEIKYSEYSL